MLSWIFNSFEESMNQIRALTNTNYSASYLSVYVVTSTVFLLNNFKEEMLS